MEFETNNNDAWVLNSVRLLRENESWTGRIHVHKHLFITQLLGNVDVPFDFKLYDYGPYSFELDEEIVALESIGFLARTYPKPGYGPQYEVTGLGEPIAKTLRQKEIQALEHAAKLLGNRNSKDLELIATCLWAKHEEKHSEDSDIIEWIKVQKPKYKDSEPDIIAALKAAKELEAELSQLLF